MQEKDGHFGTEMDKMARKWTIWQGWRGWHGDCNLKGENVLTRACKSIILLQTANNARLFNLGFRNQTR